MNKQSAKILIIVGSIILFAFGLIALFLNRYNKLSEAERPQAIEDKFAQNLKLKIAAGGDIFPVSDVLPEIEWDKVCFFSGWWNLTRNYDRVTGSQLPVMKYVNIKPEDEWIIFYYLQDKMVEAIKVSDVPLKYTSMGCEGSDAHFFIRSKYDHETRVNTREKILQVEACSQENKQNANCNVSIISKEFYDAAPVRVSPLSL